MARWTIESLRTSGESAKVDAQDWTEAFRTAMKQGLIPKLWSDLACEVRSDLSVVVRDGISQYVVALRRVDERPGERAVPKIDEEKGTEREHDNVGALGIERRLFEVYEGVQALAAIRDRDETARRLSALTTRLIACESCRCLFASSSDGVLGLCRETGASVRMFDPSEGGSGSMLCAPIQFEGRTFGIIELRDKPVRRFTAADAHVLSYVATSAAEHLRAFHNL